MPEKTITTYEGSSVTIPCSYEKPKNETYTILWFKDSSYLEDMMFTGTIVYSNTKERPQSPGYSSRVEYITDATSQENEKDWIKCDLRITDLQMTDSGEYSFRFIGNDTRYMSKALSLKVKGEQEFSSFCQCHHLFTLMSICIYFICALNRCVSESSCCCFILLLLLLF